MTLMDTRLLMDEKLASWRVQEEPSLHQQQLPETTTTSSSSQDLAATAHSSSTESLGVGELMIQVAPKSKALASTLPVEILCFIFGYLGARRDFCGLRNCASTCRQWANVALPVLYRSCGFGVFEYMPPQPYRQQNSSATVSYSDSPFLNGRPLVASPQLIFRQACYWRTLLLSCFWKEDLAENNPTLHPYLQYVENLDLLVLSLVATRYHASRHRVIRNTLFGSGTKYESMMSQHFGSIYDSGVGVLSKMLKVLLPQIGHLKSVNIFIEDDVTGSHSWPDKVFTKRITQPIIDTVTMLSRIENLEICGQENLTPAFGKAIKALRPSLIGSDNRTINKKHAFSLRISGSRRVWSAMLDPIEEFHRNKGFLDTLCENSVTLVDFDITDDWGWNLDNISEFMLRQARTLKGIRLRGIGDTLGTWQLLERMGRRGCRVRGLDLENRHVQHPPVAFEPTSWVFRSGLLKKLKYLAVENFHGITNSTTNYHMIDPPQFSRLLRNNLFGKNSSGTRQTPPIRTLVLTRTVTNPKVPEQIGAFVMHLAPHLTTLEIGYIYHHPSIDDLTSIPYSREQGYFKMIAVFERLTQLKRLKATGYAAEILLCSCILPPTQGPEANDTADESAPGDASQPRSPARPSTPVAADTGSATYNTSPRSTRYHFIGSRSQNIHVPPALPLFTTTWKSTLEELELMSLGPTVFTVHGGLTDETLMLLTHLQKLRVFTLLYGGGLGGLGSEEDSLDPARTLWQLRLGNMYGADDEGSNSDNDLEGGGKKRADTPGKITPKGIQKVLSALPTVAFLPEKPIMQKFWIAKRYIDPVLCGAGAAGKAKREKWPKWAANIANTMKEKGMGFVLASDDN